MASNPGYTFSWENETSGNQVTPQQAPPASQYGMVDQPGVHQPAGAGYGMQPAPTGYGMQPAGVPPTQQGLTMTPEMQKTLYPMNSPRAYFDNGQLKQGVIRWVPVPGEPYRPFYLMKDRSGKIICSEKVESTNDEELEQEFEETKSRIRKHVFWCFFVFGFIALSTLKKSIEAKKRGNDKEARDLLLDSKLDLNWSLIIGTILWSCVFGATHLLCLPFVAIAWHIKK